MATWGLTGISTQSTTLSGAVATTGATSLTVTSASGFPGSGAYDIYIDNEEMTVTAGQGTTTWTVTRGVNNTAAATHLNGAIVRQVYNVAATNQIWWSGATYGTNVVVGTYQTSSHYTDSSAVHLCTTNHLNNTQYVDATHYSYNGGASTAFGAGTPTIDKTATAFQFTSDGTTAVATQAATFYAYDGTTDATAMPGVTFQAFETNNVITPGWTGANGSGSALGLQNQVSAVFHSFYLGTSVTPTSTGAKTGKIKLILTYV